MAEPIPVIYDTGIYLQAALNPAGPAEKVLSLLESGEVTLFLTEEGFAEAQEILHRRSIRAKNPRLTDEQAEAMLLRLRNKATFVSNVPNHFQYARDPDDEHILNLAIEVSARYVISRDKDLLDLMDEQTKAGKEFRARYPTLTILDPVAFLNLLFPPPPKSPYPLPLEVAEARRISPLLLALRRTKDPDEIEMLKMGLAGCEAAYAYAKESLKSEVTEVQLYAGMLATAIEALGEPPTEFGNDFQCGALGSLPRRRPVQPGEMAIFDLGVAYRGYSADLCRTFVVDGEPTAAQAAAHQRVMQALETIEATVRPGVSCKAVYAEIHALLDGFQGWRFHHHLGHGIGLSAHEAPRLNPHWDDIFHVGDVFTAEPGLYGENLRVGLRIEQNYLVAPEGLLRLSHFPTGLV